MTDSENSGWQWKSVNSGWVVVAILAITVTAVAVAGQQADAGEELQPSDLQIGMAESDITPPVGFPIAGYFHERLATGMLDPLKAKAIVFRGNGQQAAVVVCDLTGVSVDLSSEIRRLAEKRTGIPFDHIAVAASHSHTAPDYYRTLHSVLGEESTSPERAEYVNRLIDRAATAIEEASRQASAVNLFSGSVNQQTPVAFNRRFVMRDGSIQTWMNFRNPEVVRAAGPIDPQIGLLLVRDSAGTAKGVFSNFALHLDTVGGLQWSGDYPYFIEQVLRKSLGSECISLFGTGCCGDINHSDPYATERNRTDMIGSSLGTTIQAGLQQLQPVKETLLQVRQAVVGLPLRSAEAEDVRQSVAVMKAVAAGQKVDFVQHVAAHRTLLVDRLRNTPAHALPTDPGSLLLTHQWAGVGESLPVEVQVISIGQDVAIVCLPGEVFVELGLAIKQGSPFRTTLVVELSNSVETCYVPTRAAYVGGGYEVNNSTLAPGSGEMLVETALRLLQDAAAANRPTAPQ